MKAQLQRNIVFFLSFFLLMISTSFKAQPSYSPVKNNWIPEDFNPKNVILLIEEHPYNEKQKNRMAEYIEKNYPYRYEIVTVAQMHENEKYSDKKIYQFALIWSEFLTGQAGSSFVYHDIDGNFVDRANEDRAYPKSKLGVGFGQVGYRKVINALVKKFKDNE